MIQVTSSHIKAYEVNGSTLKIRFTNGDTWEYHLLPDMIIQGFVDAGSKGKYFHQNIKGRFPGTKA